MINFQILLEMVLSVKVMLTWNMHTLTVVTVENVELVSATLRSEAADFTCARNKNGSYDSCLVCARLITGVDSMCCYYSVLSTATSRQSWHETRGSIWMTKYCFLSVSQPDHDWRNSSTVRGGFWTLNVADMCVGWSGYSKFRPCSVAEGIGRRVHARSGWCIFLGDSLFWSVVFWPPSFRSGLEWSFSGQCGCWPLHRRLVAVSKGLKISSYLLLLLKLSLNSQYVTSRNFRLQALQMH